MNIFGSHKKNPLLYATFASKQGSTNYNIDLVHMRKFLLLLISVITFQFAGVQKASATHMMGADITYTCVKDYVFKVQIKVYRDCRGIPLGGIGGTIRCVKSNAAINFSPTKSTIRDITPVCASASKRCNPPNSGFGQEGIEEHTYEITIDFNKAPYSNFKNCCEIRIETGQCCRNGAISTGAANQNFFTYATIDICKAKCNSSPNLTTEPIAYLCCDQPFFFNNGASDFEGDSISYSFADPLRGWNQSIGYNSGYAKDIPFDVYFPPRRKHPYNNPNADPPEGIYLDEESGDLIFTPTDCNEVTVLVLEMKEWRKDSTGKWQIISVTRRDVQMVVRQCPGNNPPQIKGSNNHSVCAGSQICFKISSDDKAYVPPPPLPKGKDDTVTLTWNRGIPGATFKIVDPTARLQEAEFCWTPKREDARSLPYQFTVTARDDACPLNAVTVRAFRVRVKQLAEATRDIDTLVCGEYSVNAIPIDGFEGTPDYTWTLRDSNSKVILNPKTARFTSNNFYRSTLKQDTIKFGKGGKYIIQLDLNNLGVNCPSVYLDTLVVPPQLEVDLALGPDTFVCAGAVLRLQPRLANGIQPFKYKWYRPVVHEDGDTLSYLDVAPFTKDTSYFLEVTDDNGCKEGDSIRVFLKENPVITLPPDKQICDYDDYLVIPNLDTAYWLDPDDSTFLRQGDTLQKEWTFNGAWFADTDTILTEFEGQYVLTVTDSLGCTDIDTFNLLVNDPIIPDAGPDQTLCWDDLMVLVGNGLDTVGPGRTGTYNWSDISTSPPLKVFKGSEDTLSFKIRTTTTFEMEIAQAEDTLTCYGYDTVTVNVNALPVLTMPANQKVCCDAGLITLQVSARAEPDGGVWSCREDPSLVTGNQFYTDGACNPTATSNYTLIYTYTSPSTGCVNKDSIRMTVAPLPRVELEPYIFACQDAVEVDLDDYVIRPINQSLGKAEWKCLDCGTYSTNDLIYNAGSSFLPDFKLRVGENVYTLVNPDADTLMLEYTFQNGDGCFNKDTIAVYIVKVPKITFNGPNPVCENYGLLPMNQQTGVFPSGGSWTCVDTGGIYSPCTNLVWGTKDTLNVIYGNSKPGLYYLRYNLGGACPVWRDTTMRIHPLPVVKVNPSTYVDGGLSIRTDRQICETDGNVNLNATPPGGIWSSDPVAAGMISGTRFITDNAPRNQVINLVYSYTNPSTGCQNADSTDITVQPMPTVEILTPEIDTCREPNLTVEYLADYANTSGITWFVTPATNVSIADNRANPTNVTFNASNDSTNQFIVIAQTDAGDACPATSAVKLIRIHPIPDAEIVPDVEDGCQPLPVNFDILVNNKVNSTNSTYNWDFGDGNTGTGLPTTHTFNTPGTNDVSVQMISEYGCDTILNFPIDVYPLPTAAFTPTPRSTTAALPKFSFNNESNVNPILGSTIVLNEWDFGDPLTNDDTSTRRNAGWFYGADTATYQVTLKVTTNYGCTDSTFDFVQVGPDILVYIPNAFSPDGSGPLTNDRFRVVASGFKTYEMIIFNRWGEKLFESTDITEGWDGNYQGQPCQQDVYAYLAKFTNFKGEEFVYDGTITLIR